MSYVRQVLCYSCSQFAAAAAKNAPQNLAEFNATCRASYADPGGETHDLAVPCLFTNARLWDSWVEFSRATLGWGGSAFLGSPPDEIPTDCGPDCVLDTSKTHARVRAESGLTAWGLRHPAMRHWFLATGRLSAESACLPHCGT